jgi:hypothetical protein
VNFADRLLLVIRSGEEKWISSAAMIVATARTCTFGAGGGGDWVAANRIRKTEPIGMTQTVSVYLPSSASSCHGYYCAKMRLGYQFFTWRAKLPQIATDRSWGVGG